MSNSVNNQSESSGYHESGRDQNEKKPFPKGETLNQRMKKVKNKILVLSGKGGVGKSTVAVNLSIALALAGMKVGLLDVDVHGPSVPKLLNLENRKIAMGDSGIIPTGYGENLKVMSIGFLLQDPNAPVIWRGPMKYNVIKQFLEDVAWGELDFLVVDSPPGTGDEPLSVAQLLMEAGEGVKAVIVTTPQELALSDVRKCINFCRTISIPILGVVENMSGFICPHCGKDSEIFKTGGGENMSHEMGVPFLGRVPIDPQIVEASDSGRPYLYHYARTETAKAFGRVINPIMEQTSPPAVSGNDQEATDESFSEKEEGNMRIAIPVANGKLALHFGHCEQFALIDVDTASKQILNQDFIQAPPHQPGLLPRWLKEKGVNMVISGGMGSRAQNLFIQVGIQVITGTASEEPKTLVEDYIAGCLVTGENICDH